MVGFAGAEITQNEILSNLGGNNVAADAENNAWGGIVAGGGLFVERVEEATLRGNEINDNLGARLWTINESATALQGGGVHFSEVRAGVVEANSIRRNVGTIRVRQINHSSNLDYVQRWRLLRCVLQRAGLRP